MNCIVRTVNDWISNNCSAKVAALSQSDRDTLFQNLFNNFYAGRFPAGIIVPGLTTGFNEQDLNFQYLLNDLCGVRDDTTALGGTSCVAPLTTLCVNYTRDDLQNPIVAKSCGCYLPASEYPPNVTRQCDATCASSEVVKLFTTSNTPVQCVENLCVIDEITINATNSTVGSITFSQLCPGCATVGANCNCIISDINIINPQEFTSINLTQNCTGSNACFTKAADGTRQQVDCTAFFNSINANSATNQIFSSSNLLIVFIVALLLLFILFVLFIFLS
ncbi:MAG: hypothetical protein Solivirus1_57 [Solivirus sp.]|uniref:DUF5857 domain-containing protein n=1 Tax=Solivirus sp. TaxID=2487772 RepID=A0A3G5AFD3_9VIRU|nr:MAG: hypothetical protein Solivirus1_57 [Solivirus sp.]